jgi:hypothetical protein
VWVAGYGIGTVIWSLSRNLGSSGRYVDLEFEVERWRGVDGVLYHSHCLARNLASGDWRSILKVMVGTVLLGQYSIFDINTSFRLHGVPLLLQGSLDLLHSSFNLNFQPRQLELLRKHSSTPRPQQHDLLFIRRCIMVRWHSSTLL